MNKIFLAMPLSEVLEFPGPSEVHVEYSVLYHGITLIAQFCPFQL